MPKLERGVKGALSLAVVLAAGAVLLFGCSEIKAPTANEALSHPFGTQAPFPRGTRKARVLQVWGDPAGIIPHGVDELGNVREEWIYKGWLPGLPIDYEYVSRTKHLFFDGENLVRWETEQPPAGAVPVPGAAAGEESSKEK